SAVERATGALAAALDAHRAVAAGLSSSASPVALELQQGSPTSGGLRAVRGASVVEALAKGPHLEHLHLYEEDEVPERAQNGSHAREPALDLHTDAGLLLAFVPPVSAVDVVGASSEEAPELVIRVPSGELLRLGL
ncbi:unnamed protein product, partial [Polarella glacialis]